MMKINDMFSYSPKKAGYKISWKQKLWPLHKLIDWLLNIAVKELKLRQKCVQYKDTSD